MSDRVEVLLHAPGSPARSRTTIFVATLLACALAAGCTALGLYPRTIGFSPAELQDMLAGRLPLKRSFHGLLTVELAHPRVELIEESNRLATAFEVSLSTPYAARRLQGSMTLSGTPHLDGTASAVYLAEPRLDRLAIEGVPGAITNELRRAGDLLAREILADQPLYRLEPGDLRFGAADLVPESVRIVSGRLVLRVRPR